jgi:hypothetical protein
MALTARPATADSAIQCTPIFLNTNVNGTASYVAVGAATIACSGIQGWNNTGTSLDFRRWDGTGAFAGTSPKITILNGQAFEFNGLLNAGQLFVKRTDDSATSVVLQAEAYQDSEASYA